MRLFFLGTGAAGGTPGEGRSRRRESSLLVSDGARLLVDVTRDLPHQAGSIDRLDAVLLTHAHRDASGGIPALREWWKGHGRSGPLPVYAHPATIRRLEERYARLDHCRFVPARPGHRATTGPWRLAAVEVPHARDPDRFPTLAWSVAGGGRRMVYASDVARPVGALERLAEGADLLVLDGATCRRRIFSHLRVDEDLPLVCGWGVGRILLTQIGRSCPPHQRLTDLVADLCERAAPAWDGLEVEL